MRPLAVNTKRDGPRELTPLDPDDAVQIQNQQGNRPNRWHNTGVVVEVLPHRQYRVMVDGSRRVTLRNRRFLRKIDPVCRKGTSIGIDPVLVQHQSSLPATPGGEKQGHLGRGPSEAPTKPSEQHWSPVVPAVTPPRPLLRPMAMPNLAPVSPKPTTTPNTAPSELSYIQPPDPQPEPRLEPHTLTEAETAPVCRSTRPRRKPDRLDL